MINVKITPTSIEISGHAEYADTGKDIVCASVSTILQMAQLGLTMLANQYPLNVRIEEKND